MKKKTKLNRAERAAIAMVREGIETGARKFGNVYPGKKDWLKEAIEEARDQLVYLLFLYQERPPNERPRRAAKAKAR